jgi:hypothetical protein
MFRLNLKTPPKRCPKTCQKEGIAFVMAVNAKRPPRNSEAAFF